MKGLIAVFGAFCVYTMYTRFPGAQQQQEVVQPSLPRVETSFFVLGDWGINPSIQYSVGRKMVEEVDGVDFIVSAGDNFYYDGVKTVKDPKFQSVFENAYNQQELALPWYIIVGNHDTRGNVQAQIDYSQINSRWNFPSRFYDVVKEDVHMIFVDTSVMLCNSPISDPVVRVDQSDCRDSGDAAMYREQLSWLEETLAASTSPLKLVFGHFPIFSAGNHGDSVGLQKILLPLLERYEVDMYLAGHDHSLQHLRKGSLDFIVSGAGGYNLDKKLIDHPHLVKGVLAHGFVKVTVTRTGPSLSTRVDFFNKDQEAPSFSLVREK